MDIQITILSATAETLTNKKGGTYQKLTVAYKDDKGVKGKDIFDFVAKDVYTVLSTAKTNEVYTITMEKEPAKDGKEYWNWKKATLGAKPASVGNSVASSPAANKGSWETQEERAKKQVYIVRQSSISSAVEALTAGAKTPPKAGEVIEYAKVLEAYVFDTGVASDEPAVVRDEFDQDIPFE